MADFEIGGHHYRLSKMNAVTQMKVARRLAPMYAQLIEAAQKNTSEDTSTAFLGVLTSAAHSVDDETIDYITEACLSLCARQAANGNSYLAVWNKQANACVFDMDAMEMLGVCAKVIREEMGGFFPASPPKST